MTLIDPEPVRPFDASPFVTYDTEEFTTPTESELVEDLPEREPLPIELAAAEKPLRRGKGYLRAEPAPDDDPDSPSAPQSDFGAGIDDEPSVKPAAIASTNEVTTPHGEAPLAGDSEYSSPAQREADSQDSKSEGSDSAEGQTRRKRRRPRRRRNGSRPDRNSAGGDVSSESAASSGTSGEGEATRASAAAQGEESRTGASDGSRKKRRRRNRRRRNGPGKDSENGGGSNSGAGSPTD